MVRLHLRQALVLAACGSAALLAGVVLAVLRLWCVMGAVAVGLILTGVAAVAAALLADDGRAR